MIVSRYIALESTPCKSQWLHESQPKISTWPISKHAVWEFALNEEGVADQDETWVKPVSTSHIPADGYSLSVAAVLKFANGLVYPGVLFCDPGIRLDVAAVAILTTRGRVLFGLLESSTEVERELKRLGLKWTSVFPLQYCTRALSTHTGRYVQGSFSPSTD